MSFLKIENISKAYSKHQALNDISAEVPKGSIYGLLGPNGSGKTTLIRIINKIIEADSGSVFLENKLLTGHDISQIGYLPEERGLYKKMKVGEQLIYFARLRGLSTKDAVTKGKKWCDKLEMTPWWNKKVEDLSKGMAQKIQFISTVMHEPKLIILDEPFSGFDPINADLIKDEILELKEKGTTIIFSTHRMESVEQLCDHVMMINQSNKILDGSKIEIKNSFINDTFHLSFKGDLKSSPHYEILERNHPEEHLPQYALIQSMIPSNHLLKILIEEVEISAFRQHTPSMNEIFVSLVKNK